MRKMSATHAAELAAIIDKLNDSAVEVLSAVTTYNNAMQAAWADLEAAVTAHNTGVEDAREWFAERVSEIRDYISERSDSWQESDKGQAYENWAQEWEDAEGQLDEIECHIDEPEPVDYDDPGVADLLGSASMEPEL